MSELAGRIQEDIKTAMRAKEKERLSVLRMLHSAVKDRAIETREDVTDEEVQKILMSYAKKREEAKAEAEKADRPDLAEKEAFELSVVKSYLPEPLDDAQLENLVTTAIAEVGASSMKDMGAVMKLCTDRAGGRADGSRISAVVRQKLG